MTTINIDRIGKTTQKRIRDEVGVRNIIQLKKLAKESGVDLGVKKETQEKRVYEYFATIINTSIEEQKQKKKEEELLHKEEIKQFKKNIKDGVKSFDFKFVKTDEAINLLEKASTKHKYVLTNEDGTKYALNGKTVARLKKIVEEIIVGEDWKLNDAESDAEFLGYITKQVIRFEIVPESTGYKLNEGGFFPFTHDTSIDLIDFQIGNKITPELVEENCFLYALRKSEIIENIEPICSMVIGRDIPQRLLKEIAETFDIYITLRKPQDSMKTKTKLITYGDEKNPHLPLGLIENHYFLIKEVPYTSYSIIHYHDINHKKRWNEFIKKDERKKRFIDSFDLIQLMKECGYFKPIELTSELLKTIYSDKVTTITTLEEVNHTNSKLNMYEEKEEKIEYMNVFFDFETITNTKTHKPYMVHIYNEQIDKTFLGIKCAKQMFYYLSKLNKPIRLMAHNAGYDIRFIYEYLFCFSMINRGKFILRGNGRFYFGKDQYIPIEIQDTYAIISSPLKDFGKMFKLEVKKEVMPYNLYTEKNVSRQFIPIYECKSAFKDSTEYDEFLKNCNEWKCITYQTIDIIKYSQIYCRMDCIVLSQGYNKFKSWIMEVCGLNIDLYVSSASIANDYMLKEGVYEDTYALSGIPREFIQKAMVGGRTMMAENKQHHVKNNVDDFDAVSLYPSAMERLGKIGGYLKGKPKIITNLSYEFLQQQDGYFVEILITKVGKNYKFPLMSKVGEVRDFTNNMVNEIIVVDKITLEDLIHYHQIEYNIIKGYYYNEGRNDKILKVITHLFETRKKEKKNKNPVEQVFKLIMNSAYGKTLLKPFDTESKYIKNIDEHISKYFKIIKEVTPLFNDTYKVEHYKSICEHFNNCFVGVEVLSMSKRIMNEVMCLAEDNNLNMYYQDTDSIHIDSVSVPILAEQFKLKYGRELIGKNMGQFHTDFSSDTLNGDLFSVESIFLGKKCYIDKFN